MCMSIRNWAGLAALTLVVIGAGCAGRASDSARIAETHKQVIKSDLLMLQDDFDSAALWNQESRLSRYNTP